MHRALPCRGAALALGALLAACSASSTTEDGGSPAIDAGQTGDAGADAGDSDGGPVDGGSPGDAGTDAGELDGGSSDASMDLDVGLPDEGMKLIPAGAFWRGCNDAIDTLCSDDEKPGMMITLPAFEIDTTEVTQEAYSGCVADGGCSDSHAMDAGCSYDPAGTPELPMVCVTWSDAKQFCTWAGKRLPTEAEWEKAARGTDGRLYPWGNDAPTCDLVNMYACTNALAEVGTHTGDSPYGVKDMAGNVWEWTNDWYSATYYATAPTTAPPGPPPNIYGHVGRGGGFEMLRNHEAPDFLRTSFRHPIDPSIFRVGIGFRCARSVP